MSEATSSAPVSQGASQSNQSAGQNVASEVAGKNPVNVQATETTEAKEAKKYNLGKIKFKGKEVELNDIDEADLVRMVQRGMGSNDAYNEAKRMREESEKRYAEYEKWKQSQEARKSKLSQSPIEALLEEGVDPKLLRQATEKYLVNQLDLDEASPEAKRAMELEKQLKEYQQREEARKQKLDEERLLEAANEYRKKIVPEIIKYADEVGLAKTAANVKRVSEILRSANKRQIPMDISRAVQITHEENSQLVQATAGGQASALNEAFKANNQEEVMKIGRELESFFGQDVLIALQRYGIVKYNYRAPKMPQAAVDTAKTKAESAPQFKELSVDEALEERQKRVQELQKQWEMNRNK